MGCTIAGFFVAAAFGEVAGLWGSAQGIFVGVAIGLTNTLFHTFYLEGQRGRWIKQLPFLVVVAIRSLVIIVSVMVAIRLAPVFLPPLSANAFDWLAFETATAVVASCFVVFGFSFVIQMNSLLGQGVLGNFLRGRYRKPNEEFLTFLFIDMIGSTGIAEKIGSTAFLSLLDQVARDFSDIVLENGGSIHKYVGDGIIVTWPSQSTTSTLRAIESFFSFKEKIRHKQQEYESTFSHCPGFRGALHGGEVVVGEMGDVKREIVFLGDTVNTVARMVSVAGEIVAELVISSTTLEGIVLPRFLTQSNLGPRQLRGREFPIELATLSAN